jgi:DNA end-binding protein Ku
MTRNRSIGQNNSAPAPLRTASRASWVGNLQLGSVVVPVKAYTAIATSRDSQLHQLHADCGQRIEYRKCCPQHGHVPADQIVKGFSYAPDRCVELSGEELAQLSPDDNKTLVLERFFTQGQLDLALLAGRSLYLAPAHGAAGRPFASLVAALQAKKKWALGRVVFSGHRQLVVVYPANGTLILHTLHCPAQRRGPVFTENGHPKPNRSEIRALGEQVDAASGPIAWTDYIDDSADQLQKLVESKVAAKTKRKKRPTNGKPRRTTARRRTAKTAARRTQSAGRNGAA